MIWPLCIQPPGNLIFFYLVTMGGIYYKYYSLHTILLLTFVVGGEPF